MCFEGTGAWPMWYAKVEQTRGADAQRWKYDFKDERLITEVVNHPTSGTGAHISKDLNSSSMDSTCARNRTSIHD